MKAKLLSAALTVSLLMSVCPVCASAADEKGKVRILVENNTFSVNDGAAWEGVLVDEWVDLDPGVSAADILNNTLSVHGYTQTGAADNWITDINGLSYGTDAAGMGGWMVGLDDWYGNGGITTLSLEDGDELMLSYSLSWGSDIGYDFSSVSTKLASLVSDNGVLEPEFSPEVTEYTLKLDENDGNINILPIAQNKGFRYKIYKNEYTPDTDNTDFKRTEAIDVNDGDVIYIGVGHKEWHSFYTEGASETVYKITVNEENDTQKQDNEPDKQEEKDEPVDTVKVDFETIFKETSDTMKKSASLTEAGSEWQILGLARSSQLSEEDAEAYLKNLSEYLEKTNLNKATDCAKYALVKAALGEEYSELMVPLADFDFSVKQGINGALYSLLAIDANNSEFEKAEAEAVQNSRQALIDYIIGQQQENGGWAFFGDAYEPDMTGMVIQALAPYYKKNDAVTNSVDKALELLSSTMNDDGTFTSYGAPNSESSSQVIIALTSLGIDINKDERFIKEKGNLLSGLSLYYKNGEGLFSHSINEDANALSTLQAFSALSSYYRFINGQTAYYDMTDVKAVEKEQDSENVKKEEEIIQKDEETEKNISTASGNEDKAKNDNAEPNGVRTFPTGDSSAALIIMLALSLGASVLILKGTKRKNSR